MEILLHPPSVVATSRCALRAGVEACVDGADGRHGLPTCFRFVRNFFARPGGMSARSRRRYGAGDGTCWFGPLRSGVLLILALQAIALLVSGCGGGAKTVKRAEPPDLASLPPQRRAVVRESYAWLGVPYRYGGCDRGGVDCSCLTGLVFRKAGVTLPRSSREMFAGGRSIKRADLLPGDLVFFRQGGREVSHVGVYVGGSFFVHASTSAGVVSTSLDDAYWAPRYAGARRYLP
jgi:hypothetical protein